MLSDIVVGWNEHLNDGLEYFTDIPKDVYRVPFITNEGWNEHLKDECVCRCDCLAHGALVWP